MERIRTLLALIVLCCTTLLGCSSTRHDWNLETLDESLQVSYIRGDNSLYLVDAHGKQPEKLTQAGAHVLAPTWSPDGSKVAFVTYGKKLGFINLPSRSPFTSQKAQVMVFDVQSRECRPIDTVGITSRFFGPKWSPDGKRLLLADEQGVHLATPDGQRRKALKSNGTPEAVWSPQGTKYAYTNGEDIFLADTSSDTAVTVLDRSHFLGIIRRQDLRALSFSPDGSKLAFADERTLRVLDLDSMVTREVHKASNSIRWISWLPDGRGFVFLSGTDGISGTKSMPRPGHFKLFSISDSGNNVTKLYEQTDFDVGDAKPNLSLDGRYVVLVSRHNNANGMLFVVATDGSGASQLTTRGWCSFPSWRPRQTGLLKPQVQ